MALDAPTIAGLTLGVLGLFGIPTMYRSGERIWKSLVGKGHFLRAPDLVRPNYHRKSPRIWPRGNGTQLEEGLPTTSIVPRVRTGTATAVRTTFG